MNEVETYEPGINIVELQKRWPDRHELPQLIIEMGNMIKPWKWGSITKLMDNHNPRGQESWARIDFSISVVGDRIEILSPLTEASEYTERIPLPELPALIPLVLQARLDRTQGKHQVRGLWHRANLRLQGDGTVYLAASWDEKPDFRTENVTKAELQQDLDKFPRSDRWREQWMN
jgi:hypothetical protein